MFLVNDHGTQHEIQCRLGPAGQSQNVYKKIMKLHTFYGLSYRISFVAFSHKGKK